MRAVRTFSPNAEDGQTRVEGSLGTGRRGVGRGLVTTGGRSGQRHPTAATSPDSHRHPTHRRDVPFTLLSLVSLNHPEGSLSDSPLSSVWDTPTPGPSLMSGRVGGSEPTHS